MRPTRIWPRGAVVVGVVILLVLFTTQYDPGIQVYEPAISDTRSSVDYETDVLTREEPIRTYDSAGLTYTPVAIHNALR